jgi:hypothetical protein
MSDRINLTEVLMSGRYHDEHVRRFLPQAVHLDEPRAGGGIAAVQLTPVQEGAVGLLTDVCQGGDGSGSAPHSPGPGGDGGGSSPDSPDPKRPGRKRLIWVFFASVLGAGLLAGVDALTPDMRHWPLLQQRLLVHAGAAIPLWAGALAAAAALVLVAWLVRVAVRAARGHDPEDVLTVVVAIIGTVAAMQGMWRYLGNVLNLDGPLRILLLGVVDGSTLTEALRARRNSLRSDSTGVDGIAMWGLTVLSGVLASLDAGSADAAVFRFAAPLVAAWLWDRGLRLKRHERTGRKIHWRLTPERILVLLGFAEATKQTADEADAQRRLYRLSIAIIRYASLQKQGATGWWLSLARVRLQRRIGQADRHAQLATNPARQEQLLQHLSLMQSADDLAGLRPQVLLWTLGPVTADSAPPPAGGGPIPALNGGGAGPDVAAQQQSESGSRPRRRRRRRMVREDAGATATAYAQLAEEIAEARDAHDYGLVHNALAACTDYDGFARWLGASSYPKRFLALVAFYGTGNIKARVQAAQWIAHLVPGPAGKVDRKDIHDEAKLLEPFWLPADPEPATGEVNAEKEVG